MTGKCREDVLHPVRDPWACGVRAECERAFRGDQPQLPSLLSVGRVDRSVPGAGPAEWDTIHRGADCAPGPEGGGWCAGVSRGELGWERSGERGWGWWGERGGRLSGSGFEQPVWAGIGDGVFRGDDSNGSRFVACVWMIELHWIVTRF